MNSDAQVKVGDASAMSYHVMVERLVKKFPANLLGMDIRQAEKLVKDYAQKLEYCHAAIGVHTEAGEVADVIKAHAIYGKELDRAALVKELGDLRFWIQDIQNKFFISDHEIVQGNADKLSERYAKITYSDKQAIDRKDKKYEVRYPNREIYSRFEHEYEAQQAAAHIGGHYTLLP